MADCKLWIGLVRLEPIYPEDWKDAAGAYTNIVTWASCSEEFRQESEKPAASMDLYVVEIAEEEPVSERLKRFSFSEELEDIVRRAESNPNATIYGTFHTYPFEDA